MMAFRANVTSAPRAPPSGYQRMRALFLCFTIALVGMGLCSISIQKQSSNQSKRRVRFNDGLPTGQQDSERTFRAEVLEPSLALATRNSEDSDSQWPKVIWLMSFPNSGTSFTGELVKQVTKSRFASNYGNGNYNGSGWSVPIHEGDFRGPFFVDPPKVNEHSFSDEFIMTKTHCGGYCQSCRPHSYDMNLEKFKADCLKTTKVWIEDGKKVSGKDAYPEDLVRKAIHLVRDPFDNIVSRFHLAIHEFKKVNDTIPPHLEDSRAGFRLFCEAEAKRHSGIEKKSELWHRDNMALLKDGIPCYADFFRWVQWHNLANQLTHQLNIPTYILKYENFDTDFEATLDQVLDFLGQARKGKPYNFIRGKEYKEYFHAEELRSVRAAMEGLATNETWALIKHYF